MKLYINVYGNEKTGFFLGSAWRSLDLARWCAHDNAETARIITISVDPRDADEYTTLSERPED